MPSFTGTVVACFTRHDARAAGLRCLILGFDANWIVTIEVTAADDDSPIQPSVSHIMIHSPTNTFFYAADEVIDMRFRFELSRQPKGWWLDETTRIT
jgi:hypothetical protein